MPFLTSLKNSNKTKDKIYTSISASIAKLRSNIPPNHLNWKWFKLQWFIRDEVQNQLHIPLGNYKADVNLGRGTKMIFIPFQCLLNINQQQTIHVRIY